MDYRRHHYEKVIPPESMKHSDSDIQSKDY